MTTRVRSVSQTSPHFPVIIDVHAAIHNCLRDRIKLGLVEYTLHTSIGSLGEVSGQAVRDVGKCSINDTIVLIGISGAKSTSRTGAPDGSILERTGRLVRLLIPIPAKEVRADMWIGSLEDLTGTGQCSHTRFEEDPRGLWYTTDAMGRRRPE